MPAFACSPVMPGQHTSSRCGCELAVISNCAIFPNFQDGSRKPVGFEILSVVRRERNLICEGYLRGVFSSTIILECIINNSTVNHPCPLNTRLHIFEGHMLGKFRQVRSWTAATKLSWTIRTLMAFCVCSPLALRWNRSALGGSLTITYLMYACSTNKW